MLDLPPILFMASARVVCVSREMEPYDMAPVQKRFTISFAGSTWRAPPLVSSCLMCGPPGVAATSRAI